MIEVILLRHAHRNPFLPGDLGNSASLTQEGVEASLALGKSLKGLAFGEIITSPLLRCVQTAQALQIGLQQDIPLRFSPLLGDPGPFILDPQAAGVAFIEEGAYKTYNQLFLGRKIPGTRSLQEGIKEVLKFIEQQNSPLCLMVSHDFLLAALGFFFSHATNPEGLWPDFLESCTIRFDQGQWEFFYKGKQYCLQAVESPLE